MSVIDRPEAPWAVSRMPASPETTNQGCNFVKRILWITAALAALLGGILPASANAAPAQQGGVGVQLAWDKLQARHSGKCLDVENFDTSNGAWVEQWQCNANSYNQDFIFQPSDAGANWYKVKVRHSGKCLDVENFDTSNGAIIQQWQCNVNSSNQDFALDYTTDGYFKLRARHSGKCLDVKNFSQLNGAWVDQWQCNPNSPNQEFRRIAGSVS
jgi:hypothetical protein